MRPQVEHDAARLRAIGRDRGLVGGNEWRAERERERAVRRPDREASINFRSGSRAAAASALAASRRCAGRANRARPASTQRGRATRLVSE